MKNSRFVLIAWLLAGLVLFPAPGRSAPKEAQPPKEESEVVRQVEDRIIAREDEVILTLSKYRPRVETYLQFVRPDQELGSVPVNDLYYLGRLELDKRVESQSFLPQSHSRFNFLPRFLAKALTRPFKFHYNLDSFVEAVVIDPKGLDRQDYHFQFVRSEFLGDVRCLVFDLIPRQGSGSGRFKGRIWVEDRDYTIVRFKGVRTRPPRFHVYYHFDSWRQNLQPGVWLPVIIYFEESGMTPPTFLSVNSRATSFRAQTRFWGYDLSTTAREDELTRILVEAPAPVRDSSEGEDLSPLASQRGWETEAENNVLERLEKARLIAPPGEVDKVLDTVVNNLMVTNKLDDLPPIRCRVMLTLPFESFTVGHTIVISRGLIDVLPDEATLATVLAHELAHLVLGHVTDTRYAFNDRLLIDDEDIVGALDFERDPQQESAADTKALELLQNSPYRNKLSTAGLFLRAMADEAPLLKQMFGAHMGNRLAENGHNHRMVELKSVAPELQPRQIDQIAAFPLGTRLKVDPWNGRVEMMKSKPAAPLSAREKMPFMVTPLFPHLTRREVAVEGPLTGQVKTDAASPLPPN
ncbi:MAG TPA: M48 family metalloprotease [Terriglobia bacterium]|nr:M48 family metalloprotease [Terriglobia bacterium]